MFKPVDVHPHALGKTKGLFQKILHEQELFYYLRLDGKLKNHLYTKGFLDGRKQTLFLSSELESYEWSDDEEFELLSVKPKQKWILAILKKDVLADITEKGGFVGKFPLNKTYILEVSEINTFMSIRCNRCRLAGTKKCFEAADFDCSRADRLDFVYGSRVIKEHSKKGRWSYA